MGIPIKPFIPRKKFGLSLCGMARVGITEFGLVQNGNITTGSTITDMAMMAAMAMGIMEESIIMEKIIIEAAGEATAAIMGAAEADMAVATEDSLGTLSQQERKNKIKFIFINARYKDCVKIHYLL